MGYCKKCKIRVIGTETKCPFCEGELTGKPEGENIFPKIPLKKQPHWMLVRLLALGTVIVIAGCGAWNALFHSQSRWSVFVAAGLFCAWISGGAAVKKRGNPLKAVLWQVCVCSVVILLWDYETGGMGWSVDFVIPILDICSVLGMCVLIRFLHLLPQDYLFYLMLNLLLGMIPPALLAGGRAGVMEPSVLCGFVCVVVFAVLFLFQGSAVKAELSRRFHL